MKKKHLFNAIMRITVINIALGLTLIGGALANNTNAQVLNRKITLNAKDKEISKVLATIEREANITFIYSPVLIQANNKVTVSFKNETLSNILSQLLTSQNIKYEVSGNAIVLNRIIHPTGKPNEVEANQNESRQAIGISGTVTDDADQPLAGVSVTLRGSTTAVSTDNNGNYKINVPDNSAVLVFRYVGFLTQEAAVNGRTVINVKLLVDSRSLNEVVVVGYGSQRKSTITGAISSLDAKTVNALPVTSLDQALQGRVAGLTVTNNGSPGTQPVVTIRGISSISFASDPLYVVDGFPTGNLASFDVKDVESVEVLKDASAAAIYGSRATNGVILITTKKGARNGKVQVNLDSYVGGQSPSKKLDLLNTNQYVQYATALDGAGNLPPRFSSANFNMPVYPGASQTYAQTNTDWQDAYFRNNALITANNLSLSGGNDVSRFYTSAGFFDQDGIAVGLSYKRYNYRINSDHKISKVFTFGENLYTASSLQHYDATLGQNRTFLTNVIRMPPYIPLHDPANPGGYQGPISSFDGSDPTNPVEGALIGSNTVNTLKIVGTAYLDVNFTSWLKFRSTVGIDYTNAFQNNYTPIFNDGGTSSASSAAIANDRLSTTVQLYTQQLNFDKTFGLHHVAATAVYEQQGGVFVNETSSGNQATNTVTSLNGASNVAANSTRETNMLQSYVARVNYEYAGKYLLSGSIRRDGSSIWAPGHKYTNFPAASIGWKIDQEDFLKNSKSISELKLRASYGITGIPISSLGNYPYLSPVQSNQTYYPFDNGSPGGGNGSFTNGLSNADLTWETTKQLNIGLDLGLFNNTVTLVSEFFRRQTDNLILRVPTPFSEGFQGAGTLENVASMRNTGAEIALGYHKRDGDFKWDVTGLLSVMSNKVLKLNTPTASIASNSDPDFGAGQPFTNTVAGQSVQYFYGWIAQGIIQTQAEAAASGQTGAAPGDIKFKDISGPNGKPDGVIDSYDKTNIGSFLPKFTYSLNYNATYKNFDLGIFFQGVHGNKILNAENIILQGMPRLFNASTAVLDAWTPSNTNTSIPRAIVGDPNGNGRLSTRWIEDGSYLRLKNLELGYSIPTAALKSFTGNAISRLKIYVSSQNLFTITKYTGFDPEVGNKNTGSGGTLTNGVDFGQYPAARVFLFGIQAGF